MNQKIKAIEDLSLNAWPSHQIEIYDGWLLRFSYFYTHRTNSVEQIGLSAIPVDEKIEYCESIYLKWGTPAIFKISPLVDRIFDRELDRRGYRIEHATAVMTRSLSDYTALAADTEVSVQNYISPEWIEALFALKGTTNAMHRLIVPSMYQAIPKDTFAAAIYQDGKIVATGLGIMDRTFIGLYAIHVHSTHRRKNYARAICQAILSAGRTAGAREAYLQVTQQNEAARQLYCSLGFETMYSYWFRSKPLQ